MVELWEESITVIHRLLPLLFFPREGGWGDELVSINSPVSSLGRKRGT